MKKQIIISFLFGALFIAVSFLGYTFYRQIQMVNQHERVLVEIINLINSSAQQAQKAQTTTQQ